MNQTHSLKQGQKVRLRGEGQDNLYDFAYPGSTAWVRHLDHDKMGYPMIYIDWDKNDWKYNGEENKWALEAHFEPIGDDMSDENSKSEGLEEFLEAFKEFIQTKSGDPRESKKDPDSSLSTEQTFKKSLAAAYNAAEDADAFMLITVKRSNNESGIPVLTPKVTNYYQTSESGLLLENQLSKLAAISNEELTYAAIKAVISEDE